MNFTQTLESLNDRFPNRGCFNLSSQESINNVVSEKAVPNLFGVYFIYRDLNCRGPVIYIGKAGTFTQDGSKQQQGIRKRLVMKQGGMYRRHYFPIVMREMNATGLSFAWFVTYGENTREYPALVEAELLASYLTQHGKLPELNKTF